MSRIVFCTQKLDASHGFLAWSTQVVDELARRVDEVEVIADAGTLVGRPANVRLRTFGASSRPQRLVRFERAVAETIDGADAFIAHQVPLYAVAAAPLARRRGVPILLWYAHWKKHLPLRLSERASTLILSADRRSFPLPSEKVRAIGQAIDVAAFPPTQPHGEAGRLRAVAVGRYSPSKGLKTIVEAVATARAAGTNVTLETRGTTGSGLERRHKAELADLVDRLALSQHVTLGDSIPREMLPGLFARSDVLVNNMEAGSADKAVYEACAACLPVLASNPVHDDLAEGIEPPLLFRRDRPGELAKRLSALAALGPEQRHAIGTTLRARVEEHHSVRSWVDGLMAAVVEARA
ncbi:MAG: glycosyltransferase family 4 protein [Actinobacteria bacterium]|nr:glycosyltransferase family 4 protein [Actinomycetota bacterium]